MTTEQEQDAIKSAYEEMTEIGRSRKWTGGDLYSHFSGFMAVTLAMNGVTPESYDELLDGAKAIYRKICDQIAERVKKEKE